MGRLIFPLTESDSNSEEEQRTVHSKRDVNLPKHEEPQVKPDPETNRYRCYRCSRPLDPLSHAASQPHPFDRVCRKCEKSPAGPIVTGCITCRAALSLSSSYEEARKHANDICDKCAKEHRRRESQTGKHAQSASGVVEWDAKERGGEHRQPSPLVQRHSWQDSEYAVTLEEYKNHLKAPEQQKKTIKKHQDHRSSDRTHKTHAGIRRRRSLSP